MRFNLPKENYQELVPIRTFSAPIRQLIREMHQDTAFEGIWTDRWPGFKFSHPVLITWREVAFIVIHIRNGNYRVISKITSNHPNHIHLYGEVLLTRLREEQEEFPTKDMALVQIFHAHPMDHFVLSRADLRAAVRIKFLILDELGVDVPVEILASASDYRLFLPRFRAL